MIGDQLIIDGMSNTMESTVLVYGDNIHTSIISKSTSKGTTWASDVS